MPTSQLRAPPINIRIAMLRRTIKPTATKAGDISPPKNIILSPLRMAISKTLFKKPVKEISPLNKAPIIIPLIILFACFASPVSCPASKTEAQAIPSGYFKLLWLETIKTCLIGIINRIPNSPPVNAIAVVSIMSNSCQMPIKINAGIVKIIPAASDSPAEAAVWIWFASNIDPGLEFLKKIPIYLSVSIPITAAGMEAETVIPAFSPRYTFAEPITTESAMPIKITRRLSSGRLFVLFDIILSKIVNVK